MQIVCAKVHFKVKWIKFVFDWTFGPLRIKVEKTKTCTSPLLFALSEEGRNGNEHANKQNGMKGAVRQKIMALEDAVSAVAAAARVECVNRLPRQTLTNSSPFIFVLSIKYLYSYS